MATVRKLPNSKYWYAQFNILTTERKWKTVTKSTKIPIKPPNGSDKTPAELLKEAGKVAEAFEQAAKGNLQANHIRQIITELTRMTNPEFQLPTVKEWITRRLATFAKTKKESAYRNYADPVKRFMQFLDGKENMPLDKVTPQMMHDFLNHLDTMYARKTRDSYYSAIRSFFRTALALNIIDRDPSEAARQLAAESKPVETATPVEERRAFTLDELKTVLSYCDEEWKSMILICLYTGGQRLGDISMLRWDAINFEKNTIAFKTQKRGRPIVAPLWSKLREILLTRLENRQNGEEYVHPRAAQSCLKNGKASTVSNQFGKILFKAGLIAHNPAAAGKQIKARKALTGKKRNKSPLSFHSLRYTATVLLHEAGVPPMIVQKIVGHDSNKIHEGYAKFALEQTAEAFSRLPEL